MSDFIMPLNMTVKHLMILSGKQETTCRGYYKAIKKINNVEKPKLVTPTMVCNYLTISYEESYQTLKNFYNQHHHKTQR
jgi:hypothetical protein